MLKLLLYCDKVTSDHNGYCSGDENEDTESKTIVPIYISVDDETCKSLIIMNKLNRLQDLSSLGFDCKININLCGNYSYYCDPSKTGKKHKISIKSLMVLDCQVVYYIPKVYKNIKLKKYICPSHDKIKKYVTDIITPIIYFITECKNYIVRDVMILIISLYWNLGKKRDINHTYTNIYRSETSDKYYYNVDLENFNNIPFSSDE